VRGHSGGVQPLTAEAFDKRIAEDPGGAVEFVLSFEDRTFPRSGETRREDAVSMLGEAVRERPAAGLELWPHLADHPDIQGTVIAAWGHAKESDDLAAIMNILVETDLEPVLHSVGQFLMYADRTDGARWEQVPATETFMQQVWDASATDELYEPGAERDWNWMSTTINVPAGLLMDFWFEMFRRRWATAGDEWRGMDETDRAFLDRALEDRTERGAFALTQMAARLHFLDAADSAWCRSRLLPLGDWADATTAEPFWWGVLSHARWNSGLVADGLLAGLLETVRRLAVFGDDQSRRWAALLASIAVRCETPAASTWVDQLTARADPADRVRWLEAIGEELQDLDETGRVRLERMAGRLLAAPHVD
jgi:hypothetical protein